MNLQEPLILAVKSANLSRIRQALQAGADIHSDDNYALRWSSEGGHLGVVKLLLDNGADVHADDDYALRWSSSDGHLEVVQLLLVKGANIHAQDDYALRLASENGHGEIVLLLFNQDPDYFTKLIEQDRTLSEDASLRALVNHYRLGSRSQPTSTTRPRHAP